MSSKTIQSNPRKAKGPIRSARERVRTFLTLFERRDNVLITINPDPDSMASAFASLPLITRS
ncbi:MAG TPA: hypothetical protein VMW90_10060 [Acidobacteriota bacterium]|nr:hypothetical protein [Acidobacteriota bacterium]